MPETSKQTESRTHNMRWDGEDWDRIADAASKLSELEHLDLSPTDIIRSGARRFAEEILSRQAKAAA